MSQKESIQNTIVDLIKVPVDTNGDLIYDKEFCENIMNTYHSIYPDHHLLIMPNNIHIWEDCDIDTLEYIQKSLDMIIKKKRET